MRTHLLIKSDKDQNSYFIVFSTMITLSLELLTQNFRLLKKKSEWIQKSSRIYCLS